MSFPVLVYFHSVDAESDWLAALHAVLDAATIVIGLTEEESAGAAALMHRAGSRTVSHLCAMFDLAPEAAETSDDETLTVLVGRLAEAGYRTKPQTASDAARFLKLRGDYSGRLHALSSHLGAERIRLVPS